VTSIARVALYSWKHLRIFWEPGETPGTGGDPQIVWKV
jgi:hypothetical protein